MSNIRPEALKNITDAVWTILRQQGDDPGHARF
jgi:hypothetical protein